MYQRFLNNNDYISIVTEEALCQLIRGNEERLAQAEEASEQSVLEYLSENYEVEKELAVGKMLEEYNARITYPAHAHFYMDGKIYETLRTINGVKAPEASPYWREYDDFVKHDHKIHFYSQRQNYNPGDIVRFGTTLFECIEYNGPDFDDIRIPGTNAWEIVEFVEWEPNIDYNIWDVVLYNGKFYTLLPKIEDSNDEERIEESDGDNEVQDDEEAKSDSTEEENNCDNDAEEDRVQVKTPEESDCWGLIGDYTPDYNYELTDYEYVVYNGLVYRPVINPNADLPVVNYNIKAHDPRNANLKKHILRLAVYELHKLISPTNISSARITDYETSITWLRDAGRLKINPQIPRKLEHNQPVADFAIATYMRDYNPYENIWQI